MLILSSINEKEDDLKVLIAKQYIIPFDSGVIIIKHWRLNNYLRRDRYTTTNHQKELSQITLDENMVYQMATNGIPLGNPDKIRLDKNRLDKIRKDKSMREEKPFDDELKEIFGDDDV